MAGITMTFKPSSKYNAVRLLDNSCVDYESYEDDGKLVVTINEDISDSLMEQLEDINVG
jgi:phage-related protein